MRRFLFPLLVLAVAGVLWLLEPSAEQGGGGAASPSAVGESGADLPSPAPNALAGETDRAESRQLVMAPLPEEASPNALPLLRLQFRADPPERLRGFTCQLLTGGTWEDPDPPPVPLDADYRVESRLHPGEVVVQLSDGKQSFEADRFTMPAADLERLVDFGQWWRASGRVYLEGEPVRSGVEIFGLNPSGEDQRLVSTLTDASGHWQSGFLRLPPTAVVVRPLVEGFRQPFGPFQVVPETESVVELPVAWLELRVEPAGWIDSLWMKRTGTSATGETWNDSRQGSLEDWGLADGVERIRIAPGRFSLLPDGPDVVSFLESGQIGAGEERTIVLSPRPSGRLRIALDGEDGVCAPARVGELPKDADGLWSYVSSKAHVQGEAWDASATNWILTAGDWRFDIAGPLQIEGSNPPQYRGTEADSWSVDFTIQDGDDLRLRLGWNESGEPTWRLESRR